NPKNRTEPDLKNPTRTRTRSFKIPERVLNFTTRKTRPEPDPNIRTPRPRFWEDKKIR
ncbi:unnamed protein product, partial [Arabidopsis halleri]